MVEKYLWIAGSFILLVLGTIHLLYTFFSKKLLPFRESVITEMKSSTLVLTKETTVWKAWMGFNASHSSGAIYIGIINIFLAIRFFETVGRDYFFIVFNILIVCFYFWLARKYWFRKPFTGIALTLICYVTSAVISFLPK